MPSHEILHQNPETFQPILTLESNGISVQPLELSESSLIIFFWLICSQEDCGACWAFSSSEVLADRFCIHQNVTDTLSPQNLVNCDTTDTGCSGGLLDNVWWWLQVLHIFLCSFLASWCSDRIMRAIPINLSVHSQCNPAKLCEWRTTKAILCF